jgi:hypothetical protein
VSGDLVGFMAGLRCVVEEHQPREPIGGWPVSAVTMWFIEADGALADVHMPRRMAERIAREDGWPWPT